MILDDPKNKNALSEKMMHQLQQRIFEASSNGSVKVIIIAAVGDVFCSGHNLKDINEARTNSDKGKKYFSDLFNLCSSLMQMITKCSKPVIAEIDGVATAAGCQLVASCDLAIASDQSKFATPVVNIGLFCSTPMVALSRNVSKKDSMKMLLTGDMIDAAEAKRICLINDHVSAEKLNERSERYSFPESELALAAVISFKLCPEQKTSPTAAMIITLTESFDDASTMRS